MSVYFKWRSWDVVVSTVSRLHTGWSSVQISARARYFFFFPTMSAAQGWQIASFQCQAKNQCSYTSAPLCGIMECIPSNFPFKMFQPATNHEGLEELCRHRSALSLTSALDEGWWLMLRRACYTPGYRDTAPIVQKTGWASGSVRMGDENLVRTGIRSQEHPVRSEWLHRLSYPDPPKFYFYIL
jgi:hypothetical protein